MFLPRLRALVLVSVRGTTSTSTVARYLHTTTPVAVDIASHGKTANPGGNVGSGGDDDGR